MGTPYLAAKELQSLDWVLAAFSSFRSMDSSCNSCKYVAGAEKVLRTFIFLQAYGKKKPCPRSLDGSIKYNRYYLDGISSQDPLADRLSSCCRDSATALITTGKCSWVTYAAQLRIWSLPTANAARTGLSTSLIHTLVSDDHLPLRSTAGRASMVHLQVASGYHIA